MAQYKFTGDQTQVFCGLQAEDGSTLVAEPGQVVEIAELHETLEQFFEPVGKASKKTPPASSAPEGKE